MTMTLRSTLTTVLTLTSSKARVEYRDDGFTLTVTVPPAPAARPRVTRGGSYYPKTYAAWRRDMDKAIPTAERLYEGNLAVRVEFACHRPKTTKRLNPRGDIDNFEKAIFDAITGDRKKGFKGYWVDDDQIVLNSARKRWVRPGETPHVKIKVRQLIS